MEYKVTFLDIMNQGGPIMWVLLGFSVIALAIVVQKSIAIVLARTRDSRFARSLGPALTNNSSLASLHKLSLDSVGPLANMIAEGLASREQGIQQVEEAMTSAGYRELKRLRRGLGVLSTTANLAPLLGFLGTVTGMMLSFGAIAGAGLQDPGMVANGIKEALTTTAAGLTVAIPIQLAYNIFLGQLDEITFRLETTGERLTRAIATNPVPIVEEV